MFTRKPRLQLEKFAINGAKRLLQHNLPGPDIPDRLIRRHAVSVANVTHPSRQSDLQTRP
jgi:hypothetical protein